MKRLFKKIILTNIIIFSLVLSGCGAGSVTSNDLSTSSIDQSYLNLKIIGTETAYPSMNLNMAAFFSLYGFNSSSLCLDPNPYINLQSPDSLSVRMNSNSLLFQQNGCQYKTYLGNITLPDNNTEQLMLNYKGYAFSSILPHFPQVYTIQSATCSNQAGNIICDVTTNRPNGESYSVGLPLYYVDGCGSSTIISNAAIGSNGHDLFNFTGQCNNTNNLSVTLEIYTNPIRITPTTNYESGNINMQYSFRYFTKTVTAAIQ